jgi:preprotein translocase subunit YajC
MGPACRAAVMVCSADPQRGKKCFMLTTVNVIASVLLAEGEAPARPTMELLFNNMLIPLAIVAVLFYLLIIRPESRKRADMKAMLQNLKKNDRVVTIGGIYGTVVNAPKDLDEVTIKVDESTNTKLRMLRSAIARVLPSDSTAPAKTDS